MRNFSLTQVGNYAKPGPSSRILNDDEWTKKNNEKKGESRPQEVPESHLGCRLHHGKNWSEGVLQRVERSATKTVRKSHKPERRNLRWLVDADDKLACDDVTAELLDANKLEFEVKLRVSNIKKILRCDDEETLKSVKYVFCDIWICHGKSNISNLKRGVWQITSVGIKRNVCLNSNKTQINFKPYIFNSRDEWTNKQIPNN